MRNIKQIACVGGGTIGSSMALQFAMKGYGVALSCTKEASIERAKGQFAAYYDTLVKYGAAKEADKAAVAARVRYATSVEEVVEDADFIQENGPERIAVKHEILAKIDSAAPQDAIVATSSSGLLLSDIVAQSKFPQRIVGAHPYNPPHLIPLVEITKCDKTDPAILDAALAFYKKIGKEAVLLQKECPGYIANRLQLALYREVKDLVLRGVCTAEDADKALVYGPGIRWAIFGHSMIMQLGNPGGLTGMEHMLGNSGDVWLADMASWTKTPDVDKWCAIAQPQVDEEMRNFPDYIGHTNEDCRAYRDAMLIEILKLHKKL